MKTADFLRMALRFVEMYGVDKDLDASVFFAARVQIPPEMTVPDVEWVVTEGNNPDEYGNGELGFRVGSQVFLYHKDSDPMLTAAKWRPVNKREFGEVIRRKEE